MFKRPARAVSRVFIHCSASDRPEHSNVETIRRWHLARGFADTGYHYFIGFDGNIEPGRSLERIPAAQRGYNRDSIAICLAGGQQGDDRAFTGAQYRSLKALCIAINQAYDGEITFHGHQEVANKACPAFDYHQVLGLSQSGHLRQPRTSLKRSRTVRGGQIASAGAGLSALETVVALDTPIRFNDGLAPAEQEASQPIDLSPTAIESGAQTPITAMAENSLSEMEVQEGADRIDSVGPQLLDIAGWVTTLAPWVSIALVMLGVGLIIFARLDDFERGLR